MSDTTLTPTANFSIAEPAVNENVLSLPQKQELALLSGQHRVTLAADVAQRQVNLQASAADMEQMLDVAHRLSRTRSNYRIRSSHTTASGEAQVEVQRNTTLTIALVVGAVVLLTLLLR